MELTHALEVFWVVCLRTWKKTFRRPVTLTFSFFQPMFWMLFFGFLMHRYPLEDLPKNLSYMSFLLPGVAAMTVLFGSSQAGISLIRDLQVGFLQRMLSTPAHHSSIFAGKICADSLRLLGQALVVILLGVGLGAVITPDWLSSLMALFSLFCFSVAFGSISSWIALTSRRQETLATFVHLVNMPIFFTSTALVPSKHMPNWLSAIAHWNPLTLAVEDLRNALVLHDPTHHWGGFYLFLFALVCGVLSIQKMKLGVHVSTWEVR